MMGGDITATSEKGKGSTFRFEINIREAGESDFKDRTQPRRVIGLAPGQRIPRILVAEDKEESRSLLVKLLEIAGFEVREAVNGREAVEMLTQWRPHFIWMDVRMPVMDGLEATRRIKATEAGKSTIVAALTAHALEEEREPILAAGCDDFVRKPYREQEIFEVMARYLGVKYIYEESKEKREKRKEKFTEDILTPEALAELPEKMPPMEVIEEIARKVEWGDYAGLERILAGLEAEDADYGGFCSRIREYARSYDEEAILKYISTKDEG